MQITNGEVNRLIYVENNLKLLNNNHLARVVHNVIDNINSLPDYIYILSVEVVRNTKRTTNSIECYTSFQDAVNRMYQHVRNAQDEFNDKFIDIDSTAPEAIVNKDAEQAEYLIADADNPNSNHILIKINKKEVK